MQKKPSIKLIISTGVQEFLSSTVSCNFWCSQNISIASCFRLSKTAIFLPKPRTVLRRCAILTLGFWERVSMAGKSWRNLSHLSNLWYDWWKKILQHLDSSTPNYLLCLVRLRWCKWSPMVDASEIPIFIQMSLENQRTIESEIRKLPTFN